MNRVLILAGSKTDLEVLESCTKYLDWFEIAHNLQVASAHRNPELVAKLCTSAEEEGYGCIIAAAGMAAALPGVAAAHSQLPILGVPIASGMPSGLDALLSIVQMPPGLPVGCLAIGKAGAKNAAVMAARIIAAKDEKIRTKLEDFKALGYKL